MSQQPGLRGLVKSKITLFLWLFCGNYYKGAIIINSLTFFGQFICPKLFCVPINGWQEYSVSQRAIMADSDLLYLWILQTSGCGICLTISCKYFITWLIIVRGEGMGPFYPFQTNKEVIFYRFWFRVNRYFTFKEWFFHLFNLCLIISKVSFDFI